MDKLKLLTLLKSFKLGLRRGTVEIESHQPCWLEAFDRIHEILLTELSQGVSLHHIGSSSLPKCVAKPILDILIVHPATSDFSQYSSVLENLGFTAKGDYGVPGRSFFTFYDLNNEFDFVHLHAFEEGHPSIRALLEFNRRLLGSAELSEQYNKLKNELIDSGVSRKKYPAAKTEFIQSVIDDIL